MKNIEQIIKNLILEFLKKNNKEKVDFLVTIPKNTDFGDFSTNVALILAKELKESPKSIAQRMTKEIKSDFIKKIEIAGVGIINFFVNDLYYTNLINNIIQVKNEFGNLESQNLNYNVEFVSANPTGFLHVAHARGAALGDSVANILETQGIKVLREYYINDAGSQIDNLAKSAFLRYQELLGQKVDFNDEENLYKGEDIIWGAKKILDEIGAKYKDKDFSDVKTFFRKKSVNIMLKKIEEDMDAMGIKFDLYFSEQSLYDDNLIIPTLDSLNGTYKKDGALWLKSTDFGDDKDRVLIKSDSTLTYLAPDIAYHKVKATRGKVDKLINIWGADHSGYIKRVQTSLELQGFKKDLLDVIIIQIVRLIKNGQEVKMSKRKGTSLYLSELIDQVGKDSARFFLVNRSNNTKIDFDIDFASLKSNDNPVFKIQYAHARITQLLNKSTIKKLNMEHSFEFDKATKKIVKLIDFYPKLLNEISISYKVNHLTQYLIDLTNEFNSFYSNSKIIQNKDEESLLSLSFAVKIIISKSLKLLGVSCPNKM